MSETKERFICLVTAGFDDEEDRVWSNDCEKYDEIIKKEVFVKTKYPIIVGYVECKEDWLLP